MEAEELKKMTKDEILDFIRLILIKPGATSLKDHYRFDMSGYESKTGQCTLENMSILNKFAFLGIYDYTNFLFIDFYKGIGHVYLMYFWQSEYTQKEFCGEGTTEIIYEIFKLTILSDKGTRRRI